MKKKLKKVFRIIAEIEIEPNTESTKYLKAVIKERLGGEWSYDPIIAQEDGLHEGGEALSYNWKIKRAKVIPLALKD